MCIRFIIFDNKFFCSTVKMHSVHILVSSGFCGSLTTYSSWIFAYSDRLNRDNFFRSLVGLGMEFWLTWGAFLFGFGAATSVQETLDLMKGMFNRTVEGRQQQSTTPNALSTLDNLLSNTNSVQNDSLYGSMADDPEDRPETDKRQVSLSFKVKNGNAFNADPTTAHPEKSDSFCECLAEFCKAYDHILWPVVFLLVAVPIWVTFYETFPKDWAVAREGFYRDICLAPFGAWCRWAFTKIPEIKESWPDMNPQTMLANQIAVLVIVVLKMTLPNSEWRTHISTGVLGSLSTVSTLFAEIHSLYCEKGRLASLRYGLVTVAVSIIIVAFVKVCF